MTRDQHLAWCKERAHAEYAYYKVNEPAAAVRHAVTSMLSDLGKHPETAKLEHIALVLGFPLLIGGCDERTLFQFIDGFN